MRYYHECNVLLDRIEDLADKASVDSHTSYDEYIRLFSLSIDRQFKHHRNYKKVKKMALKYGYVPKTERTTIMEDTQYERI